MASNQVYRSVSKFVIPSWADPHFFAYDPLFPNEEMIMKIKKGLEKFKVDSPKASIIIPMYNEQENILNVLSSIAAMQPSWPTEFIVVNNNSKDQTAKLLEMVGAQVVFEGNQGITNARNAGFLSAKGEVILSADADTIYPPNWVDAFVEGLNDKNISCVYGKYSFLPIKHGDTKLVIGLFEYLMQLKYISRKLKGREYLNVYGFNSAFRKKDAEAIGGYNLNNQFWQDGKMALDLMALGKLSLSKDVRSIVMTSSRKFLRDGGLATAFKKRISAEINRIFLKKSSI